MKKLSFYFVLAWALAGCFSLKTPLPELSYYDLDLDLGSQENCDASFYVGIAEIRSLAIYETTDILSRERDGEIGKIPGMVWIDIPKNLLKKILIKQFDANCIKASLPPFGGVKNDYLLKVEILNFEILEDQLRSKFAQVGVFYEVLDLKDFKVLQSGVIMQKEEAQDGYIPAFKDAINKVSLEILNKFKK